MKFAYADPPYLGQGKRYAHLHPDALIWDDPATHQALVDRLEDEFPDGWAASLIPSSESVTCYQRPGVILAAWVRPGEVAMRIPTCRRQCTFELVAYRTSVPNSIHAGPRVRDSLVLAPPRPQQQHGHTGTKPAAFCRWVLDLLGYDAGRDELVDLFPGEGSMARAAMEQRLPLAPTGDWAWLTSRKRRMRSAARMSVPLGFDGDRDDG